MNSSRRSFFKTVSAGMSGWALGLASWPVRGAANREKSVPGAIIDTHTHFYDPARPQGVPWPPSTDRLLHRTVLPKNYRSLPVPQPVTGTVVVEASAWLEDNQWILDLAANDPFIVGFVGNLLAGTDDFAKHLKRFSANRLFRGIRIGSGRLKEGLSQPAFLADLKRLAAADLELDLLGGPDVLALSAQLARIIPELRVVIDHVANVRIDGKTPPKEWRDGIKTAGQHRNISCKVSGLVEGTGRTDGTAPRDVEFYAPILDSIWEAFGADRLIYGSNWPVSERFASLATVQQITSDYFKTKGQSALEKVFSTNARAVYKWVKR